MLIKKKKKEEQRGKKRKTGEDHFVEFSPCLCGFSPGTLVFFQAKAGVLCGEGRWRKSRVKAKLQRWVWRKQEKCIRWVCQVGSESNVTSPRWQPY